MRAETVFLVTLIGGIALLVAALAVARLNWRKDVTAFGRGSSTVDIALHPERYAVREALPLIRVLTLLGAALLAGAVAMLLGEAVREVGR